MTTRCRADLDAEWQRKGATLSDKTARKEFGLTEDEIVQAKTELGHINRELKRLKTQAAALEGRKSQLVAELGR